MRDLGFRAQGVGTVRPDGEFPSLRHRDTRFLGFIKTCNVYIYIERERARFGYGLWVFYIWLTVAWRFGRFMVLVVTWHLRV